MDILKNNIFSRMIVIARPVHWVKNFALYAALLLTGNFTDEKLIIIVTLSFIAFSLATSATYIFNDIMDAPRDKLHPLKKNRPVASGKFPIALAVFEFLILVLMSLLLASSINMLLFLIILFYLILQAVYSMGLKNLSIIDILIIATGFIIRVYAGAFVIDAHLSVWFLLCVVSASLFLAAGKRRAELNLIEASQGATRKSLSNYGKELLNSYVTMFGNAAWMSWALYTFFESPKASIPLWLVLAELSRATTINKLMMLTIPVVIFGIMRYLALIFEGRSEAPEKLLLTDKSLIASVLIWTGLIYWILYSGVAAV